MAKSKIKKTLITTGIVIASLIVALFMAGTIFKLGWGQKEARIFEVNTPAASKKIVIASQGSNFKNKLGNLILNEPDFSQFYFKGIDVKQLGEIDNDAWDAVVVITTVEGGKLPRTATKFLTEAGDAQNIRLVITSGGGSLVPEGITIDAYTSASAEKDLTQISQAIINAVKQLTIQ